MPLQTSTPAHTGDGGGCSHPVDKMGSPQILINSCYPQGSVSLPPFLPTLGEGPLGTQSVLELPQNPLH